MWLLFQSLIIFAVIALACGDINDRLGKLFGIAGGASGSLRVALRPEPSNLSVAVHPIVNVSFAG
jgi:hypothetical protein